MRHPRLRRALFGLFAVLTACATPVTPSPDYDALMAEMMRASFREQGIAKMDRVMQDASNAECSKSEGGPLSDARSEAIQTANYKSVKMPADGKFIGDWREGERLAQNGRGMTWTDPSTATTANGGGCYNCHELSKAEISFGNIGPSLFNYGKLHGVANPEAPESLPIVDYTWRKIYNSKAFNACSGMPRFGHAGLLSEAQLKHLMALLLDPNSPVNK